jgi:hypothetical protein
MIIGEYQVDTPADRPWGYSPEWRHDVAKCVVEGGFQSCCPDEFVRLQSYYLEKNAADENNTDMIDRIGVIEINQDHVVYPVKLANDIYDSDGESCIKNKLEALILCPELSIGDIARALNVLPDVILIYERLFFNIRDDHGKVMESPWLREYFALGGAAQLTDPGNHGMYWKVKAFEGGAEVLYSLWQWPLDDNLDMPEAKLHVMMFRSLFRDLEKKIQFGRVDTKSQISLMEELGKRFEDLRERGIISKSENLSEDNLLIKLLEKLQPTIKEIAPEKKAQKQKELEEKLDIVKSTDQTSGDQGTLSAISDQMQKIKNV